GGGCGVPGEAGGGDGAVGVGGHVRLGPKGAGPQALQDGDGRVDVGLVVRRVDGGVVIGVVVGVEEVEAIAATRRLVWVCDLRPLRERVGPETQGEVGLAVAVEVADGDGVGRGVGGGDGGGGEGCGASAQREGGGAGR